jgi:hypothetical protein
MARARFLPWRSAVMAGGVGAANAALSARFPAQHRVHLAALELAFVAGAYPGMAIAAAPRRKVAVELIAGGAFVASGLVGLARGSRSMVAAGLLAHGAWDLVHHFRDVGTSTPNGYPSFCLIADVLLLIPLAARD